MSKKNKTLSIVIFSLIAIVVIFSYLQIFSNNTKFSENETFVHIPTNANYNQVLEIITPYIKDKSKFENIAKLRSYDKHFKSGRFLLKNGMGTFSIIKNLKN